MENTKDASSLYLSFLGEKKLKYFDFIDREDRKKLFLREPEEFNKNTDINILKYALGAFLYIPATQYNMMYKNIMGNVKCSRPLAICLEDAVGINGEEEAIENLSLVLDSIRKEVNDSERPLIFIRIKNPIQLEKIKNIINKNKDMITGILIPKANSMIIETCIDVLDSIGLDKIYLLPIIESKEFVYKESKEKAFLSLYNTLLKNKSRILNIRIGITDILGIFGIRRSRNFSIYENIICTNFINDIITYLFREELDIPISGGVSEFYDTDNDEIRKAYIKEILLDKFHGLVGKTVIHPNQVAIVQALCVVTYEDYMDANMILESTQGKYGVSRSISGDRMNEVNPHLLWAKKIIMLSKVYGVLNKGIDYNDLLKF